MKARRITQKDIARELGVSSSLVSRSLAGTAPAIGANPGTVRRIQEQARRVGYIPNAAARQLRGHGQPVVGLVAADLEDPYFGPAVAEVIRQSHRAGFALTLAGFERRQPGLSDVDLLLQHDLKALLILGGGPLDWVKPFVERGVAVIRIGRGLACPGVAEVTLDELTGMGLVVRHLTDLGHRKLAFIGAKLEVHEYRLSLVRQLLRRRGLSLMRGCAILSDPDVNEAGVRGVNLLAAARGEDWPTAIICSSDAVALGVLRGLANHGLRVPEHVSVTGFDDLALARLATPPLTSVRQPMAEMVGEALRMVRAGRDAKPSAPHVPSLMVRASTTSAWNSAS